RYLLRRSALRAISSAPSASFLVKPRAFTTVTSSTFKARPQCIVSPLQKRFNSDEAKPTEATTTEETAEQNDTTEEHASAAAEVEDQSTEAQKPTVGDAVDSAAQTVKETVNSAIGATADALSADDPVKRTLYIGNLFFEVGEDQVRKEFARFGNIKSSRLITDARGLSKGFCYIEYESQAEASEAIENMNQRVFEGRRITVQFHRPRGPKEERLKMRPQGPSKTLFIGNMSFDMSDKDLNDLFREIRNVIDVRVAIDRRTGQPRGFAHADFVDVASAEKAKAMLDRKQIHGRELRVDFSMSSGRYDNSRERSE
ncbi:RNA-binding domain-containing protein, partial [Saccharata proteae CBS 121410]